jgi:alanine racemase
VTQSLAATNRPIQRGPRPQPADRCHLEIDLTRVAHNCRALRHWLAATDTDAVAPGLCAVVKKDAYGLGAARLASAALEANATMLAVYAPHEARQLLAAGINAPMLVLQPVWTLPESNDLARHAAAGRLHLAVHSIEQLAALDRLGQALGGPLSVHLYLDTGMSRGGLNREQFGQALAQAAASEQLRVAGVYSHLATADGDGAFAAAQRQRFEQAVATHRPLLPRDCRAHLANTCGTLRDAGYHFDMVRPGLGLIGFGPEQMEDGAGLKNGNATGESLQPAVRWVSRVAHLQQYAKGTSVGYGATDTLERDSMLAVVPVGYGDGYPLALSSRGAMRVQGPTGQWHAAPIRGRINMDEIVIDLTDAVDTTPAKAIDALDQGNNAIAKTKPLPKPNPNAPERWLNAFVEVYSDNPAAPNALPRLAAQAQTHPYELLCRIAPHVPRRYVHG